jgi:hypothetical protein
MYIRLRAFAHGQPCITERLTAGSRRAVRAACLRRSARPHPRPRVFDYFRCNSRPVDLDGLLLLLTPDVIVDYPSGRFIGRDSYLRHQVQRSPRHFRPHFTSLQTGTARTLQCCCWSSVVAPSSPAPVHWLWSGAFLSRTPRALPPAVAVEDVAASCAVPWTYLSRSPLLCCLPVRATGCNRSAPVPVLMLKGAQLSRLVTLLQPDT